MVSKILVGIAFLSFGMTAFAHSSPCGTSGMTVVKAFDGKQFVIYSFRKGADVAFQIPGSDISFPNGTSGPKRFIVDGVVFETLFVPVSDFLKTKEKLSDVDVLKKQREFEVDYLSKSPSPLTKSVELGPRERPANKQQPAFTFYLWQMINPRDERGARQYYLTTLSEGDVVVLSAIVADDSREAVAMMAFQSFASTFQHILVKEQCPEVKK
jgi:hypothetical protein